MKLPPQAAQEILKSSTEAIVVVDNDGKIVFVNRQAELLFGYASDEMLGQTVEMLMPDAMRDGHAKHRHRYDKAPHARPLVSGLSLKGQRKNGETFDAEIALTPIDTGDGMIVSSAIRDISAGDATEAYFRNLLESAPDAMIIVDHNGRIAIANDQSVKMFGYDRKMLIGEPVEMLLPDAVRERHVSHRAHYTGDPHVRPMGPGMELAGRRADGSTFPVEISLSPVSSSAGMFVSSVIRDVTERKEMERELIAARQAAERANKANTAFLAAASHDLRQPVQALSLLNGALRRTVDTPLAMEMVESQQHSLDAMTNLLNSLLDISRLDAGAVTPEVEDFPVQRLVDRLSAEFSRQARHKGLKFHAENCGAIVRSDPNLVGEIIQNFVSNAIRYTDKGTVTLSSTEKNGKLCIYVRDTGVGIEPENLEEIFREFHQIKTPGSNKEGFGLGLAIVRRLADLLQHEVLVDSTPGSGSCFSVCMPIVRAADESVVETASTGTFSHQREASGLIILIEDDVKVASAWGMLLEAEGYRVAMAESAKEAQAVVNHLDRAPDLIISDFHLIDGSNGVQAIADIRAAVAKDLPAFIVSGDTSKVVQDARSLKNSMLMSKPV
ncbi:MAG: PAS domain S-box protein, partial [Gammaproteobacteria bacterium]|nr:PAS domain S-box protein [Gammaproteobacteria bacterium]MDH4316533.1 PAS domain S-box protein [Gammaproteobacteria bacterium]MDH5215724.1 PAS domain S-box protein [Gammaproteobacteria bacterium]